MVHMLDRLVLFKRGDAEANLRVAMRVHKVRRNLMRGVYQRREARRLAQAAFGSALTPRQLCKTFQEIDVDHSGMLNRSEIETALKNLGLGEEKRFSVLDGLQTDELNLEQFGKLMGVALPQNVKPEDIKIGDDMVHPLQGPGVVTEIDTERGNPFTVRFKSSETHQYSAQCIVQQRNVCMASVCMVMWLMLGIPKHGYIHACT